MEENLEVVQDYVTEYFSDGNRWPAFYPRKDLKSAHWDIKTNSGAHSEFRHGTKFRIIKRTISYEVIEEI